LGTISASRFAVNVTGFSTSPSWNRRCVLTGDAAAYRSAGAPFRICVSSVVELPKLYLGCESNALNASVSDEAAKTSSRARSDGAAAANDAKTSAMATPAPRRLIGLAHYHELVIF
jgi:hypothetical protein